MAPFARCLVSTKRAACSIETPGNVASRKMRVQFGEWRIVGDRHTGILHKSKRFGGRACKPDSVRRQSLRLIAAAIIPLVPASLPGSSGLPEGSHRLRRAERAANEPLNTRYALGSILRREGAKNQPFAKKALRVKSRASSPLLFGLAPRGVCRAVPIARDAVGSYPTVSPLPCADA